MWEKLATFCIVFTSSITIQIHIFSFCILIIISSHENIEIIFHQLKENYLIYYRSGHWTAMIIHILYGFNHVTTFFSSHCKPSFTIFLKYAIVYLIELFFLNLSIATIYLITGNNLISANKLIMLLSYCKFQSLESWK